jgi:ATP-binding cassette subfamily B protein
LSELNAALQENIAGINVVQLFQRERFNSELFRATNQRYITAVDKTIFYDSAVSSTLEWVSLVAIGGVLWLGGLLVMQDALTFGVLASFILFAQRLFDPLRQFADKFTAIQAGLTAVERLTDLFSIPVEIRDPAILHPDSADLPVVDLPASSSPPPPPPPTLRKSALATSPLATRPKNPFLKTSPSPFVPAKKWRWWGQPGRVKARLFAYSAVCTTSTADRFYWMG